MLIFFNFLPKFSFELLARNSSLIGNISEVFSKFTKFPVDIVSEGGDNTFFAYSVIR